MLVEGAIGDAYGLAFEAWANPQLIADHNDLTYQIIDDPKNKHYGAIKAGHYTDDTQMLLANAEALLEGDPWTVESLAERYVRAFHRDPRKGYSGGFYKLLTECRTGKELLAKLHGDSDKSGAAMRSAVLGYLPTIEEVKAQNKIQANVTHNSFGGHNSSFLVAAMAHYFIRGLGPKQDLDKWMKEHIAQDLIKPWPGGRVSSDGMNCARAAKTAILENATLTGVLKRSVSWGGDTDTIACIALACAAQCKEITNDLPQSLYEQLENCTYGKDYLADIDRKLVVKFGGA